MGLYLTSWVEAHIVQLMKDNSLSHSNPILSLRSAEPGLFSFRCMILVFRFRNTGDTSSYSHYRQHKSRFSRGRPRKDAAWNATKPKTLSSQRNHY